MWTLILTTSLLGQFHHDLDTKIITNLPSETSCKIIGEQTVTDLKKYEKEVDTTITCVQAK